MPLTVPQLKRKLRQLKQLELTLRFGRQPGSAHPTLLWDVFFSTKAVAPPSVTYPLSRLLPLGHRELKAIFDDYCARLYSQVFLDQDQALGQGQGLPHVDASAYDPQVLARLGLPPSAGIAEITQRFRVLAKQYHPDHGGTDEQFIALVAIYERLRDATS